MSSDWTGRLRSSQPLSSQTDSEPVNRPRIFGIGLNKTGTSSLHHALKRLGFRSLHFRTQLDGEWVDGASAVIRADERGQLLLSNVENFDAYSDIWPLTEKFVVADHQYPGSRFVLTTRDLDAWLDSRRRHVERNIENARQGIYRGSFLQVDIPGWTDLYRRHHDSVLEYFRDRPQDLLTIDITAGEGYEKLCPFLGIPALPEPFPKENADLRQLSGLR